MLMSRRAGNQPAMKLAVIWLTNLTVKQRHRCENLVEHQSYLTRRVLLSLRTLRSLLS